MTNPDYTAVCLLVDRSGSMSSIKTDAAGGIAEFIKAQKELPGKCTVRLIQFDNHYEVVSPSVPVADLKPYELLPRGSTALNDSWGRAITEFGEELAKLPEEERPAQVVFVVVTDGYENASREWTHQQVADLVKKQTEEWNWQFMYLAANQDAMQTGAVYGVARNNTMTYTHDSVGTQSAFAAVTESVSGTRLAGAYQDLNDDEE